VKPLLATEKAKGPFRRRAPFSDETLLGQCNATFEALFVVLRSGVGDHRALETWHASRIMLFQILIRGLSVAPETRKFLGQRKFIQGYATV